MILCACTRQQPRHAVPVIQLFLVSSCTADVVSKLPCHTLYNALSLLATGAMSVGAALYKNTPAYGVSPAIREPLSSRGGATPIFYNAQGIKFAQPQCFQKPDILAPDGTGDNWAE
jgi:hypothetical protein